MPRVTVVDYGMGNLLSVRRAFEHCGADVDLTSDAATVVGAEYLVLPGVGAFGQGMAELKKRNLIEPILEFVDKSNRPFLGICLGMQLLMESSEEATGADGLGIVPGSVRKISSRNARGEPLKIPHIGWSEFKPRHRAWEGTCLAGLKSPAEAYFVHSFHAEPKDAQHVLAVTDYEGVQITAAIAAGRVYGTQFHPEKSGETGLTIVRTFIQL